MITLLSFQVELNKAEVRWTRPVERLAAEVPVEEVQTDELYRKFQGILNKLTPQKFQSLAEQALKLDINTEERLSGCIDKIFTKVSHMCVVHGCVRVDIEAFECVLYVCEYSVCACARL